MIRRSEDTKIRSSRPVRSLAVGALALAIFVLGLSAAPAVAAPSWGISLTNQPTELPRSDEQMIYSATITNTGDAPTVGQVTFTLELSGGSQNSVFETPFGWTCAQTSAIGEAHANVVCTNSNVLNPGASFGLTFNTRLGPDSEEPTGTAVATVSGGGAAVSASDDAVHSFTPAIPFGAIPSTFVAGVFAESGDTYDEAGGHPFRAFTEFGFNLKTVPGGLGTEYFPVEDIKDTIVDAPRGFVGNPLVTPEFCPNVESVVLGLCPDESIVGGITVYAFIQQHKKWYLENQSPVIATNRPIYSLEPEFGSPAQFAFGVPFSGSIPYTFVPELRADDGYAISFRTAPIIQYPPLHGIKVDLCSFGVDTLPPFTDPSTGISTGIRFDECKEPTEAGVYPRPLITNPTRCSGPPPNVGLRMASWQHPEEFKTYEYTAAAIKNCHLVEFEPEGELEPTNTRADSPTGLTVEMTMPTDGLLTNTGVNQAMLDNVIVTFPEGMSINGASAEGLGSCTPAQVKMGSNLPDDCPESSKVGNIEIETPLIRETLRGDVYVAKQNDNPFNAPIGLYMVFDSKRDGVIVKVAGKLTPDPVTGQLVSSFAENPEWPFSRLALNFNSGPRAPLINPPECGTYNIKAEFSPWSALNPANPTPDEIVVDNSTYTVDAGPNGGPCPPNNLEPRLSAGVANPTAKTKSPFLFTLSRSDGTQRFGEISVKAPPGLTAYLKGIPYCPDVVLGGISTAEETGRAQLTEPSCPAASQVGTVLAGAGAGPFPFQAPGKVYLAGPYRGAPVSLVVITPAVAGPYDLGNVVVRNPLYVDPVTSQVTTTSDPIPTILHGLKLNVRDIRLALDRPDFTQAPTNCEPMAVQAKVTGEFGATADTQSRFQVGGCENLGFKPNLSLRLFGGTRRGAHPKLRAILTPRPGDANIAGAAVALPRSEFLDQAHIRTVCTRVQFAAKQCPQGSIYGEAEATSPLLDHPVRGPVYLRSSDNQLPDLVVSLKGPDSQPIEVHVVGRIDSINGGIRSTFDVVPDQPVTQFVLTMQGGKKGLLVNSRNLCGHTFRATGVFTGQNGAKTTIRPKMQNACKKVRKGKKRADKRKR